jgi:hypothetical protein
MINTGKIKLHNKTMAINKQACSIDQKFSVSSAEQSQRFCNMLMNLGSIYGGGSESSHFEMKNTIVKNCYL